jgi:hypothetical protein
MAGANQPLSTFLAGIANPGEVAALSEQLILSLRNAIEHDSADFEFPLAPPIYVQKMEVTFRLVEGLGPRPLDDLD